MAAPLSGFTPLLLSSLVLHLLLLGPLFALTPGTGNTGGASNRWTPGLCYRDAGKVSQKQQQQRGEGAGESPSGRWYLRPSRWTVERIQAEGCWGVRRAGGTLGGHQRDGAKGIREERLKGVGTVWRSEDGPPAPPTPPPPPPPPLHPGIWSRSSSDGVCSRQGVERGRMRRKGVVSPPSSPAFTSSPVQNGKKRAVQRTRECAQRWPASRPHLAKRGAAGAFVRASGLCRAPGSGGRRGGEELERAGEVRRPCAAWCSQTSEHLCRSSPDKQAPSAANTPSPGPLPTGCSCWIHPLSGYSSPHDGASNYTLRFNPRFTKNSDCIHRSQLDHTSACNSSQTGCTDQIQPHPGYRNSSNNMACDADGGSASVDRRAGNCSHLGRHNVIDPSSSSSSREGGEDSCLTGCMRRRGEEKGTRSGGDQGAPSS
ncbi:uncharacterized protein [Trachinotus anak]|uniref:uncharacterized protein n=1 Tax=Trachinotus anak TaxID=443729 RepID=UPI0039F239F7